MDTATLRPHSLNHAAYPTWDTAATHRFYTEVMGCKFVAAVRADNVPSTGDNTTFLHTFFAMESGECLAFFEIDHLPAAHDDGLPKWIRHIAFNVGGLDDLDRWQRHLDDHGVEYIGPTDHDGVWLSIYFFDPNGIRLELTFQARALGEADATAAAVELERWLAEPAHQRTPAR